VDGVDGVAGQGSGSEAPSAPDHPNASDAAELHQILVNGVLKFGLLITQNSMRDNSDAVNS
jgi:hypothetical protein